MGLLYLFIAVLIFYLLDRNPWQNTTNIRPKHEFSVAIIYDLAVWDFGGVKDVICGVTWDHATW